MINIFVFSQNLKLDSLVFFAKLTSQTDRNIFVTTHLLFENEQAIISSAFSSCCFKCFADYLSDDEMEKCDTQAYTSKTMDYSIYLKKLKQNKNLIVSEKVVKEYRDSKRYILSNDLGIDERVWKRQGFRQLNGEYYYTEPTKDKLLGFAARIPGLKKTYGILRSFQKNKTPYYSSQEVFVGYYDNKKYVFIGKMNRIDYRLNIAFVPSEEECKRLNTGEYETKDKCVYMTTWHEHGKCQIPDDARYAVRWAQDGYLPPNYSHKDYHFKPSNVVYYCWDTLGTQLFRNQDLPYEMIPFRKKLFMPTPRFPKEIRNILVVASGSGDWTALKNRSDDDIMVDAFANLAKQHPQIHFVYRCHPTWTHPQNVGVNAINRVHDYFSSLKLPNLTLSSNLPIAQENGHFQFSYSRSLLDEDLKNADIVFGEHSVSMIDASFKRIPFCSVNLTKRRNFFIGMNELGFPTCSTFEELEGQIKKFTDKGFQNKYLEAVENYNKMTEQ